VLRLLGGEVSGEKLKKNRYHLFKLLNTQVMFEGLWSAQTHPKDFPTNLWLTHFSDVIGASHTPSFVVWGEGHKATDGLRQLAEWGSPMTMEAELQRKVSCSSIKFLV